MVLTGLPVLPTDALNFNRVLVGDIYYQLGINYGDRVFARIMDAEYEGSPLTNITWRKLLIDATKVAGFLERATGGVFREEEKVTMAILAKSSYAYFVHMVAAWLNKWTVLLLSVKNSVSGNVSLVEGVSARVLVSDDTALENAEMVAQQLPIKLLNITDPDQIDTEVVLPEGPIEVGQRSLDECERAALYIHSSGTSGHPKPIGHTHKYVMDDMITARNGPTYPNTPAYTPLPLFHGMGLYTFVRWPIATGQIPTFVNTPRPHTSTSMLCHLKYLPGAVCFLPPSLLEDCLHEPKENLGVLKTATRVFCGGAPLDKDAERRLAEIGVPLVQLYGSTEVGAVAVLDFPGPPESRVEDVSYIRFGDHYVYHWVPYDGRLSELIVSPGKLRTPAVLNHQDPIGYATNDLWEPHPTIPGVYKYYGRKDGVTVLSNGEKTDNKQIELLLKQSPLIDGVIVFGAGQPLNGILVRQDPSTTAFPSASAFVDAIWPTIEHANTVIPKHSRIIRQMVIVVDARTKPFVLSDKKTIRTKDTLDLYKDEIDAAYKALGAENNGEAIKSIETPEDIVRFVRTLVEKVAKRVLADDDDFFEHGLDSLHSVQIRLEIKPLFAKFVKGEELTHNIVYMYPTISRLSAYLISRFRGGSADLNDSIDLASRIGDFVHRWTASLPERSASAESGPEKNLTVALTGGTGSLGLHILRHLLEMNEVRKVYCFHRGASDIAIERQRKLFQDRGLPMGLLDIGKVEFVQVNLSEPELGLSGETYNELRGCLTHIIHAAWELNFNWGVEHFEKSHIAGVRHLIDLSISSALPCSPRLVFISSIGAVIKHAPNNLVPEEPLDDLGLAGERGYGQAKFISERVLDRAARVAGVPVTVIRSGQIAGSSIDGYWAPTEYIPVLLRSSKILGKIPQTMPDTHWLPANFCGKAVVELSTRKDEEILQYYHLENPTSTPWSTIASSLIEILSLAGTRVEAIDTREWIAAVEQTTEEGTEVPAVALLQFYHEYLTTSSRVQLDTQKTGKVSRAILFGPITLELLRQYLSWI